MSVVRGLGMAEVWANNFPIAHLCNYTLASYSAAGATPPADGDIVTFTTTNWRVVLAPDNTVKLLGRVKGAPNTVDLTVNVEWLDVLGFAILAVDDLSQVTIGNSAIKDGNTTVVNNFDALATTGNLIVVEKSGTSGAGQIMVAIVAG